MPVAGDILTDIHGERHVIAADLASCERLAPTRISASNILPGWIFADDRHDGLFGRIIVEREDIIQPHTGLSVTHLRLAPTSGLIVANHVMLLVLIPVVSKEA